MSSEGHALFLTLTSKTQRRGGMRSKQHPERSVGAWLPESEAALLMEGRGKVLEGIRTGGTTWDERSLAQLAVDDGLKCGYDFGGDDPDALYLPAAKRYDGRFWQGLSKDMDVRESLLYRGRHHVLLLSNVYGLLRPTELVQLHSCPMRDDWGDLVAFVRDDWCTPRDRPVLTGALAAYVQKHGITVLIDLTADQDFRGLISWGRLWRRAGKDLRILVGCSTRASGPGALPALGHACRDLLQADESRLLSLESGYRIATPVGDVALLSPPEAFGASPIRGSEEEDDMRRADAVGRRRRGAIRFMDIAERRQASKDESFSDRLVRLCRGSIVTSDEKASIGFIENLRNDVEYRSDSIQEGDWQRLAEKSRYLLEQSRARWGVDIPELA